MTALRGVILCADDYGMTEGIDRAILALAAQRCISAISAMVDGEYWPAAAAALKRLSWTEIGLHVVLTERPALTGPSPLAPGGRLGGNAHLAVGAFVGRISTGMLRREIDAQISRFVDGMGRYPDFIDAHQHVHLYPVIGSVLTEAVAARREQWSPWLRVCSERLSAVTARSHGWIEAAAAAVASAGVARNARRHGIRTNNGFSGFYNVARAEEFARFFPSFLLELGQRHLIMCHPGFCKDEFERSEVWMRNREYEYAYFASEEFRNCLQAHGVELRRYDEFAGAGPARNSA